MSSSPNPISSIQNDLSKREYKHSLIKSLMRKVTEFYSGTKQDAHRFPTNYNLLDWVLSDLTLRTALQIKYSTVRRIGYSFSKDLPEDKKKYLRKIRFNRWIYQSYWQEAIFRNSFTELGIDSTNTVTSLGLIKTDEVEIVNRPDGTVTSYLQIVSNPDSKTQIVNIPVDKVVHIAYNLMSTSPWGVSELKTIISTVVKKKLIESFISWLFESNQFRTYIKFSLKDDDDAIIEFLEQLRSGMFKPTNFLIVQGDNPEIGVLRKIEGFTELLTLLNDYRNQIYSALQIPPLLVGGTDSANRSNSEYQVRYAFYTGILADLKTKEDEINNELLPKLGINPDKYSLKFDMPDEKSLMNLIDSAIKLKSIGANYKQLNAWLIDNGLDIKPDMLEEQELKLDKNSDQLPSRRKTQMDFAGGSELKN